MFTLLQNESFYSHVKLVIVDSIASVISPILGGAHTDGKSSFISPILGGAHTDGKSMVLLKLSLFIDDTCDSQVQSSSQGITCAVQISHTLHL